MATRSFLVWSLALAVILTGIAAAVILALPGAAAPASPPEISARESAETLAALTPRKRQRPVIAVIGANDGSETTDYLIPYGVLKRAEVGDVIALATRDGPIRLMPALTIMPDATIASFDAKYPEGADYVIVPAMHNDNDAASIAWIRRQASKGAIIIGICSGARILGNAGLLDGRRATTHWYDVETLRKRHPNMRYVADRRFVVDRGIATTTGVSASIPMSLTLIEAIAGPLRAAAVARDLGIDQWDARHDSNAFRLNRDFVLAAANALAFWRHETLGINIERGVDEVALALVADAWSRTYRSTAVTLSVHDGAVATRSGLAVVPDRRGTRTGVRMVLPPVASKYPASAIDRALADVETRYGSRTVNFVAMQLEYPGRYGARTGKNKE